jgi:hypothetical protein
MRGDRDGAEAAQREPFRAHVLRLDGSDAQKQRGDGDPLPRVIP